MVPSSRLARMASLCGLSAVALLSLSLAGCAFWSTNSEPSSTSGATGTASAIKKKMAKATIEGRSNSKVAGDALFTETDQGVVVTVLVRNAPPGSHGVHIHEKGDCSAADAASAGPHFNPTGHKHGGPTTAEHHAGDLGNMTVTADGIGKLSFTSKDITLSDGPNSIMNRSVVVHEKADDLKTDPAGNSGARIGCGVIKAAP
jgi:superoxide dismutase, Cu-Zn family